MLCLLTIFYHATCFILFIILYGWHTRVNVFQNLIRWIWITLFLLYLSSMDPRPFSPNNCLFRVFLWKIHYLYKILNSLHTYSVYVGKQFSRINSKHRKLHTFKMECFSVFFILIYLHIFFVRVVFQLLTNSNHDTRVLK